VKLAQLMASRADIVPEPYLSALGTLADQVPPVPVAEVRREIVAAYGRPVEEVFEAFDDVPLAAASLGQVHRARHAGEEVVVKVLRPGIERLVHEDVRAATRLLDLAMRRWPHPHLRGVRNAVAEFGARVWEELDFEREAANAQAMRDNFGGRAGVAVPRVVHALTRPRVLVLEYMRGARIDRLQARVAAGTLDARALVQRVIELYMHMMLVDGFFHADPHPGNLLVDEDGTIVVLDFGMVVRVPVAQRRTLARTAFAGIRRDVDGLVDGFYALGVAEAGADRATLRRLVETLLEIAYTPQTTTLDRMNLLADRVLATMYDFPVTLPSDLVYFARTAALIEGLGTRYDARFNAVTFAAPVALKLRGPIMASLNEPGAPPIDIDWAALVGSAAGQVASVVASAGREVVGILGRLVAEVGVALDGALTQYRAAPPNGAATNGAARDRAALPPAPAPRQLPAPRDAEGADS
jgi:predicted unusual protein kinase regulating ubiquinone biosynthesis (AarF/ABC1/UbiB family)